MLTNVKQHHPPQRPAAITSPSKIRTALEEAGVDVGPDPHQDGLWTAIVDLLEENDGETVHLVAFGGHDDDDDGVVRAYRDRGTLESGRKVSIVGDRLVLEEW